jgi:hypothetical protein
MTEVLQFPTELSGTGKYKPLDPNSEQVILRLPSYDVHLGRYYQQKLADNDAAIEQIKVNGERINRSVEFRPIHIRMSEQLNYENSFLGY